MVNATTIDGVQGAGEALLQLHYDADRLLCTEDSFIAAEVYNAARKLAVSPEDADYLELNARSQTTSWEPTLKNYTTLPPLEGYASKHWGGQVGSYYAGRITCFIERAVFDMQYGLPFNHTAYIQQVTTWTYQVRTSRTFAHQLL